MRFAIALILLASACHAANTNQVEKVQKEKKIERLENKFIVKERDKGSKKESDWQIARELPLMFANNRKARKPKAK